MNAFQEKVKEHKIVVYPLLTLIQMVKEEQIKLRETSQKYVRNIRMYISDNIASQEIYLPPLVATTEPTEFTHYLPRKLVLIDGVHRLKAYCQLEGLVDKYINSDNKEEIKLGYDLQNMLKKTQIPIQLFNGLTSSEAWQLYIDMNTKGKQVALSKKIEYDSREGLNLLTNRVVHSVNGLQEAGIDKDKLMVVRPANEHFLSLTQLRKVVHIFITERIDIQNEQSIYLQLTQDQYVALIRLWFDYLFAMVPPHKIGNFHHSMLADFPLVLAVALYANKNCKNKDFSSRMKLMKKRMEALQGVDWSKGNPVWETFNGSVKGRKNMFFLNKDVASLRKIIHWLESQGGEA
ncbi:hypothetical protein H9655_15075 [Cytobacillus sp. Sa5YUA1]|uniref:DGQHR domain-containing protein n=1 Tax=Cytobacillus stercorigallinarum TaxID=2762240 RepID=A0ABR8QS39_9BACI|nr:DNA sulfur modification protein DndB [Cytobacillus stercorigallinarum]MBD7938355.1 hypothetical protein [Cytobacillus stercorigallinarum]